MRIDTSLEQELILYAGVSLFTGAVIPFFYVVYLLILVIEVRKR